MQEALSSGAAPSGVLYHATKPLAKNQHDDSKINDHNVKQGKPKVGEQSGRVHFLCA